MIYSLNQESFYSLIRVLDSEILLSLNLKGRLDIMPKQVLSALLTIVGVFERIMGYLVCSNTWVSGDIRVSMS